MKVWILDKVKAFTGKQKRDLKRNVIVILKRLKVSRDKELSVTFIDDQEMRHLNACYRSINRTTDVVSFPQDGPDDSILGDVVISIETAIRRSNQRKSSLDEEIHRLMVHGILHLLGYDHKKRNEARLMREKEVEILSGIEFL